MNVTPVDPLGDWTTSLAILVIGALLGWLAQTLLFRRLRRLSERTATRTDDVLLDSTRRYWLPVALFAAVLPAVRFAPVDPDRRFVVERLAVTAVLLLVTLAASRFVGAWFASEDTGAPARPSLIQKVTRLAVLVAGTLLVLDNAGIEIKTLLTALGVGSLAVALALQPTLSNLFAGIHLSVSKPIRVGDFVELEDGTQGIVEDIGWRATRLRQQANNLVVVPNARLSDMRLINYSLPEPGQALSVPVGIAFGSDLAHAERVALEVAAGVQREVPEADPGFEPVLRFSAFGDSGVLAQVALRARAFEQRAPVIHAFVVRLHERFAAEGIEMALPQRVVRVVAGAGAPPVAPA